MTALKVKVLFQQFAFALIVLLTSMSGLAFGQGNWGMTVNNTNDWSQYYASVNDSPASFIFDDGLSGSINDASQTHALKIEIKLKSVRDDGLPAPDEWTNLNALIDELEARIRKERGLILGHATYSGHRWIIALVHEDSNNKLRDDLRVIASANAYSIDLFYEEDSEKSAYWSDLYPDEDSRRVLNDGLVLNSLAENGDDPEAIRPVNHWSYFKDKTAALEFSTYLTSEGYEGVEISKHKDGVFSKPHWLVRSRHEGTMLLNDITSHTLKHDRKARSLMGHYDGWEALIVQRQVEP